MSSSTIHIAASHSAEVSLGITLILCSLVCLGTWPTVMRLCTLYPFTELHGNSYDDEEYGHGHGHGHDILSKQPRKQFCTKFSIFALIKKELGQGRHPCHVYLDYAISYVIFGSFIIPAFLYIMKVATRMAFTTLQDEFLDEDPVAENLAIEDEDKHVFSTVPLWNQLPLILIAMVGGSLLAVGNITMQWSTTAYHAPLTTVLALQGSTCVVVGTYWNYVLQPEKTGKPVWLFSGVSMFICAIVCSVVAQKLYVTEAEGVVTEDENNLKGFVSNEGNDIAETEHNFEEEEEERIFFKKLNRMDSEGGISLHPIDSKKLSSGTTTPIHVPSECKVTHRTSLSPKVHRSYGSNSHLEEENGSKHNTKQNQLNTEQIDDHYDPIINFDNALHSNLSPKDTAFFGIAIALFGGLCFGFFSPALNIAVNDPFHWASESSLQPGQSTGLSVTFANSCFGVAFTLSSVLWNLYLMKHPPSTASILPSSLENYLNEPWPSRHLAIVSGVVCSLGNVLQFQGGGLAGFAAADMVQAFPLVATIWDVLIFDEFSSATYSVLTALILMYATYICGIFLLAGSIAV